MFYHAGVRHLLKRIDPGFAKDLPRENSSHRIQELSRPYYLDFRLLWT